jgi:hypothetical protein
VNKSRSLVEAIDHFVYIKNGYSFWKHLVPFSVAATLLVIMSLPDDNLLLKLVELLNQPGWLWFPAALLTIVACGVYGVSIYIQVRQAYLWTDKNVHRSILTALLYLLLCSLMALAVLRSALCGPITWGAIWACILLAALSLTGIGWSGPESWVESIGIKAPDYTQTHIYGNSLKDIVGKVRQKSLGEQGDIEDFLNAAGNLRTEITKNKDLEPDWAKSDLELVSNDFRELIEQTKVYFPLDDKQKVERFATACNFKMESLYPEFVNGLKLVNGYWDTWKKPKRR